MTNTVEAAEMPVQVSKDVKMGPAHVRKITSIVMAPVRKPKVTPTTAANAATNANQANSVKQELVYLVVHKEARSVGKIAVQASSLVTPSNANVSISKTTVCIVVSWKTDASQQNFAAMANAPIFSQAHKTAAHVEKLANPEKSVIKEPAKKAANPEKGSAMESVQMSAQIPSIVRAVIALVPQDKGV